MRIIIQPLAAVIHIRPQHITHQGAIIIQRLEVMLPLHTRIRLQVQIMPPQVIHTQRQVVVTPRRTITRQEIIPIQHHTRHLHMRIQPQAAVITLRITRLVHTTHHTIRHHMLRQPTITRHQEAVTQHQARTIHRITHQVAVIRTRLRVVVMQLPAMRIQPQAVTIRRVTPIQLQVQDIVIRHRVAMRHRCIPIRLRDLATIIQPRIPITTQRHLTHIHIQPLDQITGRHRTPLLLDLVHMARQAMGILPPVLTTHLLNIVTQLQVTVHHHMARRVTQLQVMVLRHTELPAMGRHRTKHRAMARLVRLKEFQPRSAGGTTFGTS